MSSDPKSGPAVKPIPMAAQTQPMASIRFSFSTTSPIYACATATPHPPIPERSRAMRNNIKFDDQAKSIYPKIFEMMDTIKSGFLPYRSDILQKKIPQIPIHIAAIEIAKPVSVTPR